MITPNPELHDLVEELRWLGRTQVTRAYHTQLLADALHQMILPAVAKLNETVQRLSGPAGPLTEEAVRSLLLNPGMNEMLVMFPDALADIQDAWATFQLLNSWQPGREGPASAARLRRNKPTDAWQEETVERSISNATNRIAATRGRLSGYVATLLAQSSAYKIRSSWQMVSGSPELQAALNEVGTAANGLAHTIKDYAKVWGVELD